MNRERKAQKWEHNGASWPLHTRQPAGRGPWEEGQQQEHGTQHAGLAAASVQEPEAAVPAQAVPRPSRWAGGPVLGWTATSGGRERGWQTDRLTSEPLPKACQGLRAPLPLDLCLLGGGSILPDIGQVTTNTTPPDPILPQFLLNAEFSFSGMALLHQPPTLKFRSSRPFSSHMPCPAKAQVTPQTQWKKKKGFYSQASKDLQTRVFHFKKGRGNTGSLRRGCGPMGWARPPQAPACLLCPLPGPEGWLVTGDRGGNMAEAGREEKLPQRSHLTLKGEGNR